MKFTLAWLKEHLETDAVLAGAIALLIATPASAQRAVMIDVPVIIGGNAEFDACNGYGEIARLMPPDDFLSVRSGPAAKYREIDRLKNGARVFVCGDKSNWAAIVYPATEERDCGVGTPWPKRKAYRGPCKRGWISLKYLKMLAG
jgi:uncharacterized protein YgiM (DUF1202 family)